MRLPEGRYEYDEAHYCLRGVGQQYRIGDKIQIRVVETDIVLRHIDFELSNFHREIVKPAYEKYEQNKQENKKKRIYEDGKRHRQKRKNY
jgi:hypothetical protein